MSECPLFSCLLYHVLKLFSSDFSGCIGNVFYTKCLLEKLLILNSEFWAQ